MPAGMACRVDAKKRVRGALKTQKVANVTTPVLSFYPSVLMGKAFDEGSSYVGVTTYDGLTAVPTGLNSGWSVLTYNVKPTLFKAPHLLDLERHG
jgi:hypothetical protein